MEEQKPVKLEYSGIPNALTFKWGEEPEIIHFIRTGFTSIYSYHVIQEDGYEVKPDGKDFLMGAEEIQKKFGIDIKAEFKTRFSGDDIDLEEEALKLKVSNLSDDDIFELIENSLVKVGNMYHIDYFNVLDNVSHINATRFYNLIATYSKQKGICIMTAQQKDNGKTQS